MRKLIVAVIVMSALIFGMASNAGAAPSPPPSPPASCEGHVTSEQAAFGLLKGGVVSDYLHSVGTVSVIAYPVAWRSRVVAVVGFQDSKPRRWKVGALPLLERLLDLRVVRVSQADLGLLAATIEEDIRPWVALEGVLVLPLAPVVVAVDDWVLCINRNGAFRGEKHCVSALKSPLL